MKRIPGLIKSRALGSFLIVLALLTVAQGLYLSHQNALIAQCQAQYNDQFSKAIIERNEASNIDRDNIYNFMSDINRLNQEAAKATAGIKPGSTEYAARIKPIQAEYLKILQEFVDSKKEADAKRAKNPLPGYPPECGQKELRR